MSLKAVNKVEINRYELEVEVDAAAFKEAVTKAFRKNIGKLNIPGFRKGKAPRAVVEKMYGKDMFYEDAINDIYPVALDEAAKESKLDIIDDKIGLEIVSAGEKGLVFKAVLTVKPEVTIGSYKALPATRNIVTVDDADVDAEISNLQERNGRIITVEDRAAQMGDSVVINFEGSVDDVPFEGGKGEDAPLELGAGQFIPGFEEQIVGHKVGDAFDVTVTFPEEYHAEDLAGKPAVFKTELKEIKMRELPEIDDEFAKDVSEFDTLDELRADIRAKIIEKKEKASANEVENQLIDQLIEGLTAEIPEVMFENKIDDNIRDFDYRLRGQGLDIASYLKYTNMEMESFRKTFREQSEKQVKVRLALEKVAELEEINPTEDEVAAEYTKMAESYNMDVEKIRSLIPATDLKKDISVEKAINLVKESAIVTEVEAVTDAGEDTKSAE